MCRHPCLECKWALKFLIFSKNKYILQKFPTKVTASYTTTTTAAAAVTTVIIITDFWGPKGKVQYIWTRYYRTPPHRTFSSVCYCLCSQQTADDSEMFVQLQWPPHCLQSTLLLTLTICLVFTDGRTVLVTWTTQPRDSWPQCPTLQSGTMILINNVNWSCWQLHYENIRCDWQRNHSDDQVHNHDHPIIMVISTNLALPVLLGPESQSIINENWYHQSPF